MGERILRWFGDRRNETILEMTYHHLELTTQAVRELYEMVQAVYNDPLLKKKLYEDISVLEMRADQLRRDMVTQLSERDVYPNERDDLMELVRAVDWIADWAREAGRILVIVPFERMPEDFRRSVEDMCRENYDGVRVLANCIRELTRDPKKALDMANHVELFEENIDDIYAVARAHLVEVEDSEISITQMILINEFINAIETVADWCENTADIVRAIAIRQIKLQ
jgi:predicted phosphate transport protein (TIGR00153 family)